MRKKLVEWNRRILVHILVPVWNSARTAITGCCLTFLNFGRCNTNRCLLRLQHISITTCREIKGYWLLVTHMEPVIAAHSLKSIVGSLLTTPTFFHFTSFSGLPFHCFRISPDISVQSPSAWTFLIGVKDYHFLLYIDCFFHFPWPVASSGVAPWLSNPTWCCLSTFFGLPTSVLSSVNSLCFVQWWGQCRVKQCGLMTWRQASQSATAGSNMTV